MTTLFLDRELFKSVLQIRDTLFNESMQRIQPAISIIIPTLNEEKNLPVLLESLKKQTFRDFEIIVADAGSSDGTRQIAETAGATVVAGGMPGPGRNRGAEVARGDLLFFFDADVSFAADFLYKIYHEMQDRYYDLATCEFRPISDLRLDRVLFQFANLVVKVNQAMNPRAAGFCIFVSRRLFRRVGGFDESITIAEDHDFVQRASKYSPLRFCNSAFLHVSIRRLEKEGRFSLAEKYMQVELHLLTKGAIRNDLIEYEFASFENSEPDSEPGRKRFLDSIEERLINLENLYNEQNEKNPIKKLQNGLEEIASNVMSIFKPRA